MFQRAALLCRCQKVRKVYLFFSSSISSSMLKNCFFEKRESNSFSKFKAIAIFINETNEISCFCSNRLYEAKEIPALAASSACVKWSSFLRFTILSEISFAICEAVFCSSCIIANILAFYIVIIRLNLVRVAKSFVFIVVWITFLINIRQLTFIFPKTL